jgi:hypothetical protein
MHVCLWKTFSNMQSSIIDGLIDTYIYTNISSRTCRHACEHTHKPTLSFANLRAPQKLAQGAADARILLCAPRTLGWRCWTSYGRFVCLSHARSLLSNSFLASVSFCFVSLSLCPPTPLPPLPPHLLSDKGLVADWEVFVGVIAANILEEQTPKRLLDVRSQFYDLLVCEFLSFSSRGRAV